MFDGLVSVYNPFNNTQLTAICEYLSKKEAEGLKLFKYTSGKFTFKKVIYIFGNEVLKLWQ